MRPLRQRRPWLALALLLPLASPSGALGEPGGAGVRLIVEVEGLRSSSGRVGFALFDSAPAFAAGEDPLRRSFLEIEGGRSVWTVDGLPPGRYAVKVFHDLNGNGRLDFNLLGMPSEPYGFSRDARGRFGPPRYKKARFRLRRDEKRIVVAVR